MTEEKTVLSLHRKEHSRASFPALFVPGRIQVPPGDYLRADRRGCVVELKRPNRYPNRVGVIIAAPTGSGKSFWVNNRPDEDMVDGDTLVEWPEEYQWWLNPAKCEEVQSIHREQLQELVMKDDIIVLFSDSSIADIVLVVDEDIHKQRLIEREKTNTLQPGISHWDRVNESRLTMLKDSEGESFVNWKDALFAAHNLLIDRRVAHKIL